MMYYYDSYYPFHMFGFGSVFMIIFWCLIIYGVVKMSRKGFSSGELGGKNTALDILKERYAKGEITKHQFEEMKKDISN